jgi:hypothetical protein
MTKICSEDGIDLVSLKREGVWWKFATTEREATFLVTGPTIESA